MSQSVQCPGCGKQYPLTPELAGKKVQCAGCGTTFAIPAAAGANTSRAKTPSSTASGSRSVQCPGCGKQYPLTPELAGKKVQCAGCGTAFAIPAATGEQSAPSKPRDAGGGRSVRCPGCGKQYPVTPEMAGKKVQCAACQTAFAIPGPGGARSSASAPEMRSPSPPAPASPGGMADLFDDKLGTAPAAPTSSGGLDDLFADELGDGGSAGGASQGSFSTTLPPSKPRAASAPVGGGGRPLGTLAPKKKRAMGEEDGKLLRFGIGITVFGALAMILPLFGLQFKILNFPGAETAIPTIAIVIAAAGAALIWYAQRHNHVAGAGSAVAAIVSVLVIYACTQSVDFGGGPAAWFGGSKADRLLDRLHSTFNELTDVLKKVHDLDSARAVAGEVDALAEEFAQVSREVVEIGPDVSPEEGERLKAKYDEKMTEAANRLGREARRVSEIPGVEGVLGGSFQRIGTTALKMATAGRHGGQTPAFPSGSSGTRSSPSTASGGESGWIGSHSAHRRKMIGKYGAGKVVTIELLNLPEGGGEYANARLDQLAPEAGCTSTGGHTHRVVTLAPVESGAAALAAKIDFGTVSKLDAAAGTFVVTADRSKFPSPPPAPVTDPRDPNFYKQNLADLEGFYEDRKKDALERLKDAEPKELKKEIAAAMAEIAKGKDHFMRTDALNALCRWGDADLVEDLLPLISDEDAFVAEGAAKALATTNDPRAAEAIAARMGTRLAAGEYLKQMGPMAEEAVLAHIDAANERNCREACDVLLAIGSDKSVPRLKELTGHADRVVKKTAGSAIRRIESGRSALGTPGADLPAVTNPNAPNFYKQNLADLNHYDDDRRRDAMERLQVAEPKELQNEIAEALLKIARSDDRSARSEAVEALAVWAGPETVPGLIELLGDKDTFLVDHVMTVLVKTGDPRAAEALAAMLGQRMGVDRQLIAMGPAAEEAVLALLDSKNEKIVAEACKVLGEIGTRKSLSKLKRLARSNNFLVRVNAERAAMAASQRRATAETAETGDTAPPAGQPSSDPAERPTGPRGSIDGLLLQLQLSTRTAGGAANKLAAMPVDEQRRAEVSAALIKLLSDADTGTRPGHSLVSDATKRSALAALAVWVTPEDLPTMAQLLNHRSDMVRSAVFEALGKVKTEQAARAVAAKLLVGGPDATKALGAMGPIGERVVLEYLNSDNATERSSACMALAEIGTEKSLPKLKELAAAKQGAVRHFAASAVEAIEKRQK